VGAADANVTQAEAQVSQKAAALTVAQTNLNYTVIRSPIDGTVVARNVDVGQTVAASSPEIRRECSTRPFAGGPWN